MTQQTRTPDGPGPLSRWMQRTMNARTVTRIRRKTGTIMGMDVFILHTVGSRTEQPRQVPVTWFADPEHDDAWLVVASGGGKRNPDWYANMMAHPDRISVEPHGDEPIPVTPHRLDGDEREQAWKRIATDQPRYGKYQKKSTRVYPVVRLTRT
ncbi:nitroreductase family deazaflavin-dependent oxidoreductase [Nocardia alni]|uniref:nitroreductase family deazaflavin-dependent oxidoreductase n=1 Tax=Nocardia alni TaxID=2815723 RepID=UPI001C21D1E4|nr:nitroreductase family deazaflavin-dependent oxidoreductase [Nocardia alni]